MKNFLLSCRDLLRNLNSKSRVLIAIWKINLFFFRRRRYFQFTRLSSSCWRIIDGNVARNRFICVDEYSICLPRMSLNVNSIHRVRVDWLSWEIFDEMLVALHCTWCPMSCIDVKLKGVHDSKFAPLTYSTVGNLIKISPPPHPLPSSFVENMHLD